MRLFIAEKPSLGLAIAQYLPVKGIPQGGGQGRGATHIIAYNLDRKQLRRTHQAIHKLGLFV